MDYIVELCAALDAAGVSYKKGAPLCELCTFRIGGPAALAVFPDSEEGLIAAVNAVEEYHVKYIVIGNGSNILFSDDGYDGAVISTVNIKNLSVDGNILFSGCGAQIIGMSLAAGHAGLSGIEFAYGIPGTAGGGVFMNAGAYGSQLSDIIVSVRCYDTDSGRVVEIPASGLAFDYRHSVFMEKGNLVILSTSVMLKPGNKEYIEALMRETMKKRRDKQPLEYPSAGSVFKRKAGYFMGQIIEESGLKGYRIGGAMVSEKHAGFIVNAGGATAKDVLLLVDYIKKVILKNYGFEAECEIKNIS